MPKIKRHLKDLYSVLENDTKNVPDKAYLCKLMESIEQEITDIIRKNDEMADRIRCLEDENDWFKSALDALPNPIFLKNERGEFTYFNSRYEGYFNMKSEDFLYKTVLDLEYLQPEERKKYQSEDMRLIINSQETHYICDFPNETDPERKALYWSKGFTTNNTGQKGLIGEIVDISLQERLKEDAENELQKLTITNTQIRYLMKHDGLTGLYNRRIIDDFVNSRYQEGKWLNLPVSLLLIDIDYFKQINDKFGHLEGDRILQAFSKILEKLCSDEDLLIRYGGEEFLIIIKKDKSVGIEIAERIRVYTENNLTLQDNSNVTVSIGVTELVDEDTIFECVQRADKAMYLAKSQGRNSIFVK